MKKLNKAWIFMPPPYYFVGSMIYIKDFFSKVKLGDITIVLNCAT